MSETKSYENPYEVSSAKGYLWDKINGRKNYIQSQLADIDRAEKNMREAQKTMDKVQAELDDILRGEELLKDRVS